MNTAMILLATASVLSSQADPPKPLVDSPHPLITEVLFAVPKQGDANGDGERQVAGDEFVELVNPHDKPINLKGYALIDRNEPDKSQFKFVFPDFTLEPGGVVLVFNGHDQSWAGSVGRMEAAPSKGLDRFGGAFVFTAQCKSGMVSFANDGDFVLLITPKGQPVHAIHWGDCDPMPPTDTALVEKAPEPRGGSVQRDTLTGKLVPHTRLNGLAFSPGVFPLSDDDTVPAGKPGDDQTPDDTPEQDNPAKPAPKKSPKNNPR
jgi:hypothetical protein